MAFSDVMANLVSTLQTDPELTAFCLASFRKPLTVKRGYKKRHEIGLDELPIIRITHPQDSPDITSGNNIVMHTVRLYCGFGQDDCELAVDQSTGFDELIRAALLKDRRRGRTAQTTIPGAAVNDEGSLHPSYFTIMDLQIETRSAG
jgi:hypothetical protein